MAENKKKRTAVTVRQLVEEYLVHQLTRPTTQKNQQERTCNRLQQERLHKYAEWCKPLYFKELHPCLLLRVRQKNYSVPFLVKNASGVTAWPGSLFVKGMANILLFS